VWIPVKPRHDALLVNVGDLLEVWSFYVYSTKVSNCLF
jgi:isopenicillin N synthase-like dioxygenase